MLGKDYPYKLPSTLSQEDIDFLKSKHTEIVRYFQLRLLLSTSDEETKKYGSIWNWSLAFKDIFEPA